MLVNIEKINKYYNGNHVLRDICLTIEDNDRLGLIGDNGCGKSTLLRILTGLEIADKNATEDGGLAVSSGATIGFLQQNGGLDKGNSIIDEMKSAFAPLLAVESEMRELAARLENCPHEGVEYTGILGEYDRLSALFETRDGYLIDVKIKTVLNGMGFPADGYGQYQREISTLSGGEKTRLAIAKLLLESPNLLVLDEPTNHLDFQTIVWLEDYLQGYKGALFIVSHDRYFLDRLCTSVAEIEKGRLTRYTGNYSAFVVQKAAATLRLSKEYEAQQIQIAALQDYVDRNRARASTAKSARSRQNTLDKLEIIEAPSTAKKQTKLRFEYDITPPKEVLFAEGMPLIVGEGEERKELLSSVKLEVRRGEKLAIIGGNGTGKSSLLKLLQGQIPTPRTIGTIKQPAKSGRIEWANNVKISYFDQENARLNPNHTVMEEIHNRFRRMSELEVRTLLGGVRLVGENVFKKVSVISGGERAKLCFAIMMQERGNVLILDEPTNHLDLSTKEVLEEALEDFDGTMVFVSHDRYLLNRLATRIVELENGAMTEYKCGFTEYLALKKSGGQVAGEAVTESANAAVANGGAKSESGYRSKEDRRIEAARRARTKELEESIERDEVELFQLEEELARPESFSNYAQSRELCERIEEIKLKIAEQTEEWAAVAEAE